MIGLIGAIDPERVHLASDMTDVHTEVIAGIRFDRGQLDGHRVVLVAAGMGKVNSAVAATLLADRFHCRIVVFFGVAGGLDPALNIGDIVIADRVVQHDAGLIENDRLEPYQPGHVRYFNPTERFGYPADPALLSRVVAQLKGFPLAHRADRPDVPLRISYGTILTGDQFLHCGITRDRLYRELGGQAVEMEGGAVAQVCEGFGIPWLIVRALSDLAGGNASFDFPKFVDEAAATAAEILRRLLPVL
jgi:adenosylhomocysteine nucleosidase